MEKLDLKKLNKPKEIKIRNHFRIKILKVLFLVTILPLVIISVNSLYTVIKTRKQNISELQMLAIENAGEKVNKFFEDQKIHLLLNSDFANLAMMDSQDPKALKDLIYAIKSKLEYIEEIAFIDKNGWEIKKIPELELRSVKNKNYFETALSGRVYFGEIEYADNNAFMQLSEPILNKNNVIVGVVAAKISLSPINNIVNGARLGKTGFIYLSELNGRAIASSDINFARPGDDLSNNYLVNSVLNGNTHNGLGEYDTYINKLGDMVIFAGRPVNYKTGDKNNVNWYVLSEWPKDDAYSVVDNLINRSILIILVSFIFAVVLGLFLVRQVVRPIETLFKSTEQITKGNFNHRVNLKTGDEFEILGENFNKMIKVLKENERLKEEFVFIAAHELRTPVTAIRGYLDMVLNGTFGDISKEVKDNLKIINKANERLVQLVHDLLEVARGDAGRMEINIKPIDISENIISAISQLKSLADEKGIKINYKKPPERIKILADSYKLDEVLINLIGNAIKYMLGSGSIDIWHDERGGFLATSIKDHGIGMGKEDMAKLFSKFYRIQNDDTRNIEGTGLGLYVCKQIIDRMEGRLKVKSEAGKGSTFIFFLKIARD